MLTENDSLAFANEVLVLRCQHDMAAAAAAIFNRHNDAVFFIAQQSFINAEYFLVSLFN